jgi:hypothetical protein
MTLQLSYTSVPAPRALRAAQRRVAANGRTCLRAARFAGRYHRLPLGAPRRFRAHSRVQRHTRAPLARHRYPLLYHRAHCIVRLRWTSLSSAGRHISCIRACEDARLGVSSGELSGRVGNVGSSAFFFSCGHMGWAFFFDTAKHETLNTVMDWRRELVRRHM